MNYWKIKRRIKFRFNGDCVLEDDVDLILKRLKEYLKKNSDKVCKEMALIFKMDKYIKYSGTEVRKLTFAEIEKYLDERQ